MGRNSRLNTALWRRYYPRLVVPGFKWYGTYYFATCADGCYAVRPPKIKESKFVYYPPNPGEAIPDIKLRCHFNNAPVILNDSWEINLHGLANDNFRIPLRCAQKETNGKQ